MTYIDIKVLKKLAYRKFVEQLLKENTYIIISTLEKDALDFFGESVSLPKNIDYHNIYISENEQLYCYVIRYYDLSSAFNQYDSLVEFFDFTNVYRLMFVANNEVTVECMYDEIIVYR